MKTIICGLDICYIVLILVPLRIDFFPLFIHSSLFCFLAYFCMLLKFYFLGLGLGLHVVQLNYFCHCFVVVVHGNVAFVFHPLYISVICLEVHWDASNFFPYKQHNILTLLLIEI